MMSPASAGPFGTTATELNAAWLLPARANVLTYPVTSNDVSRAPDGLKRATRPSGVPEKVTVWPAITMLPLASRVTALNCPEATWLTVAAAGFVLVVVSVAGTDIKAVVELLTNVIVAPLGIPVPQMAAPTSAGPNSVPLSRTTVVDPLLSVRLTERVVAARRSLVKTGLPVGVYSATTGTGAAAPPQETSDELV